MIQRIIISTFFILMSFVVFAQTEDILVQAVDKTIEIKYITDKKIDPNNKIMELVAKAKGISVQTAMLSYKVKEHQKIIKNPNNLQLQLSIGNLVFSDDVAYQKFSINSYLSPSLISYTYIWADENDKILKTETIKNKSFKNGAFLLKENIENTYTSIVFKLYLSEVSFGFSDADVAKLEEYMAIIDGYYNADARLNLMEQELGKITTDSIEMLQSYRQQTIDNVKVLNLMRSERYSSKLDLDASDPIQYKSHFGRVEVQNRNVKNELDKTIDNMHVTYYLKGKDWLNWNDKDKAKVLFNKSISEKASYAPPYYELAKIDFENKLYSIAIDSCSSILNTLKPDTDTRYNTVKLAESVIYIYIEEINQFIANSEFVLAMEKLTLCENYSKSIPGVKNFEEFDVIHGKLYNAYYNDLADLASKQIENKQLSQAQFNVDSLAQFRNLHSSYIQNPEKEQVLIKGLYSGWINVGKEFLENNKSDSALFSFTQASNLCNKHKEVVKCTDELSQLLQQARLGQYKCMISQVDTLIKEQWADSAITLLNEAELMRQQNNLEKGTQVDNLYVKAQQIKYAELVKTGAAAYEENKSREALAFFEEALSIENTFKIIPDTALQGKIVLAAQRYVILLCIQGETLLETFQLANAQQKLADAETIYSKYNLTGDEESTLAISTLKEKLQSGNCEKVKYDYNVQSIAAKKFIEQKEFIYASQALEKAAKINQLNGDCNISDSINRRVENEIGSMLYYQKQMVHIKKLLESKEFDNVIKEYEALTVFYHDSCVNNFGVIHKPLYSYITTNANLSLIDFSVKYYTEMGKTDTAMILLDELFTKGYISSWSEESQIALGTQLAIRDFEVVPPIDPKLKVYDYTKENKWYNYLKKAYLQQWKLK